MGTGKTHETTAAVTRCSKHQVVPHLVASISLANSVNSLVPLGYLYSCRGMRVLTNITCARYSWGPGDVQHARADACPVKEIQAAEGLCGSGYVHGRYRRTLAVSTGVDSHPAKIRRAVKPCAVTAPARDRVG